MSTRTVLSPTLSKQLEALPQVQDATRARAEQVADRARSLAAKDTGAGAASIHAEQDRDGSWRVSWDSEHDYMRFPEFGTENMAAQPALRPAARE